MIETGDARPAVSPIDTRALPDMLHGMWFLWKGSAAKIRALIASLQFTPRRVNEDAAAQAMSAELDAQEFGERIAQKRSAMTGSPPEAPIKDPSDG